MFVHNKDYETHQLCLDCKCFVSVLRPPMMVKLDG